MVLRRHAKDWSIKEQLVNDSVTGLSLRFGVSEGHGVKFHKLTIIGDDLPFGNRDLYFTEDGLFDGGGTGTAGACDLG